MTVNYRKLWDLLDFSQLNRSDLQKVIEVSSPTMTKLARNEVVSMDVILRICHALHCDISDVMEVSE
jgi:putative transcriptional regulator